MAEDVAPDTRKECTNCGLAYANADAHREQYGHSATEVTCTHLFAHCVTWEDKARMQERIDYARSAGDMMAVPILLENSKWCPDLDFIPPKPEESEGGKAG